MKKEIIICIILLIIPLSTEAWDWNNHKAIMEKIYYSIPYEVQSKIDLEELKRGSIAPDKDFHDNRLHHYPESYNKTIYWLDLTKEYIKENNYKNASYSFGVASHYISDSFVAPHYISGEDPKLHTKFEYQASTPKTKCKKEEYNINKTLYKASIKNPNDWNLWLKTENKEIPQKEIEQASELIFPVFLDLFNTTCEERSTKLEYESWKIGEKTKTYLIILGILIIGNIKIKRF